MSRDDLTKRQREVLWHVIASHKAGRWYRAAGNGERVTLASLYHNARLLDRRAWRGAEGEPDSANEYQLGAALREQLTLEVLP